MIEFIKIFKKQQKFHCPVCKVKRIGRIMNAIPQDEIERFVNEVVHKFDPHRVILFGSHASGHVLPDSDVDLLVIMEFHGRPQSQAFKIRREVSRTFPLDLIVRKPSEINYRIAEGDYFFRDILENGKVLYERTGQ